MIKQQDVTAYFDSRAENWDSTAVRREAVIARILEQAEIGPGVRVLDVACGTGILIPDYLRRGAASVTGVDISERMIAVARAKFPDERVRFFCADAMTGEIGTGYDRIVIYNAFPHFPDPEGMIARLSSLLVPGGLLTAAHGMSREKLTAHHAGAEHISLPLPEAEELAALFGKYLRVGITVSDETMYQVVGKKPLLR